MDIPVVPDAFAASLLSLPGAAILLDLLIESLAVLLFFFVLAGASHFRLHSRSRYLIWTVGMLSLPVLAGLQLLGLLLPGHLPEVRSLMVIPVEGQLLSAEGIPQDGSLWGWWLLAAYSAVVLLLLGRLALGLYRVRCIRRESRNAVDSHRRGELEALRRDLGIGRSVVLATHPDIRSPVSFGARRPMVVLPEQAVHWDADVLEDVLVHELCHIRRFDWPVLVIAQAAACLFWANPLVWWAMRNLRREAEYSCDADVVASGRDDCGYARSLLYVAERCYGAGSPLRHSLGMAAQSVTGSVLGKRLQRILRGETCGVPSLREYRATALILAVSSVVLLAGLGTTQVIALPDVSPVTGHADLYPLSDLSAHARYPEQASQDGQEGWVRLRFSVDESGQVPRESIEIIESVPPGVFDQSAIKATAAVQYRPRIREGVPVPVSGVQYVLRYELEDP